MTGKHAARRPELDKCQRAIRFLQTECGQGVGREDRAVGFGKVKGGVVAVGDEEEAIVRLGPNGQLGCNIAVGMRSKYTVI